MLKKSVFRCQWNNYPAQPDTLMTRERAAKLIQAWRRNSRKNTNSAKWVFKRLAPHVYFVKINDWDKESHTMYID